MPTIKIYLDVIGAVFSLFTVPELILIACLIYGVVVGLRRSKTHAPYVPNRSREAMRRMFVLADLKPGEHLLDIGSGDGRVVRYAAKYRKAKATGIEISWLLFLRAQLKQWVFPYPGVRFRRANVFKTQLPQCDVVYVYGLPGTLSSPLWPKMRADLAPGTRVITYRFPLLGVKPTASAPATSWWGYPSFRYDIPLPRTDLSQDRIPAMSSRSQRH